MDEVILTKEQATKNYWAINTPEFQKAIKYINTTIQEKWSPDARYSVYVSVKQFESTLVNRLKDWYTKAGWVVYYDSSQKENDQWLTFK